MNDYHIDVDYSREQDQRNEERDRHDVHEEDTFERALREAKEVAADEAQADYERDDKIGAI